MDPKNPETAPPTADAPTPATAPRRRLWPRIAFGIVLLLVLSWIAAPLVLSMDWVRARIESSASESLGVPVTLAEHEFGWFSGLSLGGLEIANPPGYSTRPALAFDSLEGAVSIWRLALGKVDLAGQIRGLRVRVEQRSDGSSNFGEIFRGDDDAEDSTQGSGEESERGGLERVALDLKLHEGNVEVLQDGVLVESMENLSMSVQKAFGSNLAHLMLGADLRRPGGGEPGRVDLEVSADTTLEGDSTARLETRNLDLARYAPLLGSMLEPGAIRALGGVVNGDLTGISDGTTHSLGGELTIDAPHLAGDLVGGLDIRSERWLIRPTARVEQAQGRTPTGDFGGLLIDLGFARIEGMDGAATAALTGDPGPAVGLTWTLDAGPLLAASGTDLPDGVALAALRCEGRAALPLGNELPQGAAEVLPTLRAEARLAAETIGYSAWIWNDLDATLGLSAGQLSLGTGPNTRLNGGAFSLNLAADATDLERLPTELRLAVDGSRVQGEAAEVLQYLFPLLAGFGDTDLLALDGVLQLDGTLRGPVLMDDDRHWLEWANRWTGKGSMGMSETSFRTAPAIQGLLALTGQGDRLRVQSFSTDYSISEGAVVTQLGKLSSQAQKIGLEGRVGLDGSVDYRLDITEWMRGHEDGAKILAVLGDARLTAGLIGSLEAPELALPDLKQLLMSSVERLKGRAIEEQLRNTKDVFDRIFGGKKK